MKYLLAFLLLPSLALAQPSITGVTTGTTFSNGATVTIAGSGFGTKGVPGPLVWDDLESGDWDPFWTNTSNLPVISGSRHPFSNYLTACDMAPGSPYQTRATFEGGGNLPKWFCQYWFKLEDDWDWGTLQTESLSNIKHFRIWTAGTSPNENTYVNLHGWANNARVYTEYVANPMEGYTEGGYKTSWTLNKWMCIQVEYQDSDYGVPNGLINYWRLNPGVNNEVYFDTGTTCDDDGYGKRPTLGFYNSTHGFVAAGTDSVYFDEGYMDTTFARVEIGENASYDDCTHREIQICTSWSAAGDEIEFTMTQGSFVADDVGYVFVTDRSGNVSVGHQIVFGEASPGPSAPGVPQHVQADEVDP